MARNPWPPHLDSITLCPNTIQQISDHNQNQKKSWAIRPLKDPSDLVLLIVWRSFRCWVTNWCVHLSWQASNHHSRWHRLIKEVQEGQRLLIKCKTLSLSLTHYLAFRPVKCINPRISQAWFTVARLKCIKGRKFLKTSSVMNDAYRMPRTT